MPLGSYDDEGDHDDDDKDDNDDDDDDDDDDSGPLLTSTAGIQIWCPWAMMASVGCAAVGAWVGEDYKV